LGLYTISTSESELMDRTYMVTPTLTAWPETQSYICGGQLIDHWSDWSDQLEARPCPFYPDFILILSKFYPDFIQILSLFYKDKIQVKWRLNRNKIWIKGHGRHLSVHNTLLTKDTGFDFDFLVFGSFSFSQLSS
jgi:hypothetical protein